MKLFKWLFDINNVKILKYTDYKIKQALWLQRRNEERTNLGTNTDVNCFVRWLMAYNVECKKSLRNKRTEL